MNMPATGGVYPPTATTGVRWTVSQVCRAYPGSRGRPSLSPSTVTRWILRGCPSLSGDRVRLKAVRVGARWLVDPADLDAFFDALGTGRAGEGGPNPKGVGQANRVRRLACSRAEQELKRRGA